MCTIQHHLLSDFIEEAFVVDIMTEAILRYFVDFFETITGRTSQSHQASENQTANAIRNESQVILLTEEQNMNFKCTFNTNNIECKHLVKHNCDFFSCFVSFWNHFDDIVQQYMAIPLYFTVQWCETSQ